MAVVLRPVLTLVGFLWVRQSFVRTKAGEDTLIDMSLPSVFVRVGTNQYVWHHQYLWHTSTSGTIPHQRTTY